MVHPAKIHFVCIFRHPELTAERKLMETEVWKETKNRRIKRKKEKEKKIIKKRRRSLQHPVFPGGHPSKY